MARGRSYCAGGSGSYTHVTTAFGITYNSKPEMVCCGYSSVMGSSVKGVAIDTHDLDSVYITTLRSTSTGTYVDWVSWGTIY